MSMVAEVRAKVLSVKGVWGLGIGSLCDSALPGCMGPSYASPENPSHGFS